MPEYPELERPLPRYNYDPIYGYSRVERVPEMTVRQLHGAETRLRMLGEDVLQARLYRMRQAAEMLLSAVEAVGQGDWATQSSLWRGFAERWRDNFRAAEADNPKTKVLKQMWCPYNPTTGEWDTAEPLDEPGEGTLVTGWEWRRCLLIPVETGAGK